MKKLKLTLNTFEKNTCEKAIAEIKGSFIWSESDEGADYWVTVCEKLEKYIDRKDEQNDTTTINRRTT